MNSRSLFRKLVLSSALGALLSASTPAPAQERPIRRDETVGVLRAIKFDSTRDCQLFKNVLPQLQNEIITFDFVDGDCEKPIPPEILYKSGVRWGSVLKTAGIVALYPIGWMIDMMGGMDPEGDAFGPITSWLGEKQSGTSYKKREAKVIQHPDPVSSLLIGAIVDLSLVQDENISPGGSYRFTGASAHFREYFAEHRLTFCEEFVNVLAKLSSGFLQVIPRCTVDSGFHDIVPNFRFNGKVQVMGRDPFAEAQAAHARQVAAEKQAQSAGNGPKPRP
jgi:hypothetical protein